MNNLLNIIIVLLIVGWLIGYIGFGAMVGSLIHILLIVAVVAILFRIFGGRKAFYDRTVSF
ncbi:MAG: lmo0937 family membrane protein [Flavobacteriales bacterium]|nr:lmo0937 family membrane protein [Flavobacteriales bacterium]